MPQTVKDVPQAPPIMDFFEYSHLPPGLQHISAPLCDLAFRMLDELPMNAETSAGLRKLLEAKDCFVRSALSIPKKEE